jgi:hypothetical protein
LFSRITFREPFFVGGPGNTTGLADKLPTEDGLKGCIRHLEVNDHVYSFNLAPLGDSVKGFDVGKYSSRKEIWKPDSGDEKYSTVCVSSYVKNNLAEQLKHRFLYIKTILMLIMQFKVVNVTHVRVHITV